MIEEHICAVKSDDLRFDMESRRIGRGVHMGDKADSGQVLASWGSRNMGINDAALANHRIGDAELMKFILKRFGEFELLSC